MYKITYFVRIFTPQRRIISTELNISRLYNARI